MLILVLYRASTNVYLLLLLKHPVYILVYIQKNNFLYVDPGAV